MNRNTVGGKSLLVVAFAVSISMLTTTAQAFETTTDDARIAEVALEAAPAVEQAPVTIAPDGAIQSEAGVAEVTVPADASDAITFESGSDEPITIGVPGGADGTVQDGAMVYENTAPATDIVVQPTSEGAITLIKIDNASAPTSFPFPVTVPLDGQLVLTDDGGASVLDATGTPVVGIPTPWAKDAAGNPVPTRFEIIDNRLVQHVDHTMAGVQYPVVADPWLQWIKGSLKMVWKGFIVNRVVVAWYEARGYQCDWWAAWWNATVACYQTVR